MSTVLDQSKPHQKYFEAICNIPHPSTQEKAVSDYVCSVAEGLGLDYEQDKLWNVIVRKPASKGYENAPAIMLQAHMDMVCVKEPESNHVFETDPLKLYIDENNNVRARGTTLGADDGYGCAYLLALMEENDYPHPPLELVFTSQEENGCWGAEALDVSRLKARRMIGLDVMGATYEWTSTVSCYSSDLVTVRKNMERETVNETGLSVEISGVQPVHSGSIVHPEQFNCVKIIARLLFVLREKGARIRLSSMNGGVAENYPPVSLTAGMIVDGITAGEAEKILLAETAVIESELQDGLQSLCVKVSESEITSAVSQKDTDDVINLLYLMPSNTFTLDVKDGSMTSTNNVGMIEFSEEKEFTLTMSNRNRNREYKNNINRRIELLCSFTGATAEISSRYEPWDYDPDSYMRKLTAKLMKEFYGHEMTENICPGGLECCNFLPEMPGLDIVMFAPIGEACHTTGEYLNLDSFDRVYDFVKLLLLNLGE